MPKIAIVTDTGCDLPQMSLDKYGIQAVPLVVRFGTEVYLDDQLRPDQFWNRVLQGPPHPETSQPSSGMFEQSFASWLERGYDHVLCLTITSKHSGTFNSAYAAAQNFPGKVTVFDTLSLSNAQGYQAIIAAQAAADGRSLEEIIATLESLRARTHLFIALDTIEYLRRGGRANQIIPILERVVRVLNIKPVLELVDGQLSLLGAARSHEKAVQRLQQEVGKHGPAEMLIVAHTRRSDEASALAHLLAEQLRFPPEQVMLCEAGSVLSSHAGPGVLATAIVSHNR